MNKNLNKTLVLYTIFACIFIAWAPLAIFFGDGLLMMGNTFAAASGTVSEGNMSPYIGGGICFIAVLIIGVWILSLSLTDKEVKARTKDLFIFGLIFLAVSVLIYVLTVLVYVALDVRLFLSIVSFLGLVFFIYVIFRMFVEQGKIKSNVVEKMLGNKITKQPKQEKKSKELTNGSLEEKPNYKKSTKEEKTVIEIEVDEE